MNENKKIFSINLAAYLITVTDLIPQIIMDASSKQFYFVFPQTDGVEWAVERYKDGNPTIKLHSFLKSIKQVRESISAAREGVEPK